MVTITRAVPLSQQAALIDVIDAICKTENGLTPRSKKTLLLLIAHGGIAVAHDETGRLVGWLIAERIYPAVQELGMAYIQPEWRGQGIRNRLIESLLDDTLCNMAITYRMNIAQDLVNVYGFKICDLRTLALKSRGRIVTKRLTSVSSIRSVLRHTSEQKPIYLLREAK